MKEAGCEEGVVVRILTASGVVRVGPGDDDVDTGASLSLRKEVTLSESSGII